MKQGKRNKIGASSLVASLPANRRGNIKSLVNNYFFVWRYHFLLHVCIDAPV
jgi:hypothetical protein